MLPPTKEMLRPPEGAPIVEDFGGEDPHGHFDGTIHHVVVDIDPSAHPDSSGYVTAALRRQ